MSETGESNQKQDTNMDDFMNEPDHDNGNQETRAPERMEEEPEEKKDNGDQDRDGEREREREISNESQRSKNQIKELFLM